MQSHHFFTLIMTHNNNLIKEIDFNGLSAVEFKSPDQKSSVVVTKFGAHICKYTIEEKEILFLSKNAVFDVRICFCFIDEKTITKNQTLFK